MAEEKSNHALTCKIWKTPNHTFFVCEGRQKHRLLVKINFESKYFRWHTPVGGVEWKSSYTKIMVSGGRYVGRIGWFSSFHKGSEKKVEKLLEREKIYIYGFAVYCRIMGIFLRIVWSILADCDHFGFSEIECFRVYSNICIPFKLSLLQKVHSQWSRQRSKK